MFNQFYKKSVAERLNVLLENNLINQTQFEMLSKDTTQLKSVADQMIENMISTYEVPYGIAPGFLIDGIEYAVPMATEEPSVIAAASFAAKTIARGNGFTSSMDEKYLVGEIVFDEFDVSKHINVETLKTVAFNSYPSIIKYGGGIIDIYFKSINEYYVCYVVLDTSEAMGANMMNTILEALANHICDQYGFKKLMAILSNYGNRALVKAQFKIKPTLLTKDEYDGYEICERMIKANEFAKIDIYRATTHNKGIMNGVSAVVLASGNDTRAIEAAIHSYALGKPLTNYYFEDDLFVGEITLPLNLGVIGGSIKVHPMAQLTLNLLNNPSSKQLARIIACVGLAQNFAALRALVSSGIQKGHMKLHYKTLAINCGAKPDEIESILKIFNQIEVRNEAQMKLAIQQYRESKNVE